MEIRIRNVRLEDVEALIEIYRPYVENTSVTFEYVVPSFEEFAERIQKITKRYPYLVAEVEGKIVGYAYASTFKDRAAYDWCVETSIYLSEEQRGKGIGKRLYQALEEELKNRNILNANACITYAEFEDEYHTNASMHFHEKMGYTFVGRFHKCGYKFGKWYDMIWMEKMLGEHRENPPKVNDVTL